MYLIGSERLLSTVAFRGVRGRCTSEDQALVRPRRGAAKAVGGQEKSSGGRCIDEIQPHGPIVSSASDESAGDQAAQCVLWRLTSNHILDAIALLICYSWRLGYISVHIPLGSLAGQSGLGERTHVPARRPLCCFASSVPRAAW